MRSGSLASLIKMFSSLYQLILTTRPTFTTPILPSSSLEGLACPSFLTSRLGELVAAVLPFLMQMCANRKHCSSAWLSISVTPLCSGLSLVPLREMFPFKCYLSVSFKTSSFLFWQTARRNGRNRLIEQAFQGRGEMGRERCSAGASLTHPCLCLTFSLLSRGWVIL